MWHSFHVFHEAPDELVAGCVRPLVRSLKERGLVERFFFLRYWERGFHLRLRFLVGVDREAVPVRAEISESLGAYLTRRPSTRSTDAATYLSLQTTLAGLEGRSDPPPRLAPINSIVLERYEPELAKYGGPHGMEIAERLFDHSSSAVMDLLPALEGHENKRFGVALTMMLLGLRAFGVPRPLMAGFFDRYRRIWRGYLQNAAGSAAEMSPTGGQAALEALRLRVRSILEGDQRGPFRAWAEAVEDAASSIAARAEAVLPQVLAAREAGTPEAKKAFLLTQYLHVHNNRLGLTPIDECHLALLASSALEAAS